MRFFVRVREFKLSRFNPIYSSTIWSEPDQPEFSPSWNRSFAGVTFFFQSSHWTGSIRVHCSQFGLSLIVLEKNGMSRMNSIFSSPFCKYRFNPEKQYSFQFSIKTVPSTRFSMRDITLWQPNCVLFRRNIRQSPAQPNFSRNKGWLTGVNSKMMRQRFRVDPAQSELRELVTRVEAAQFDCWATYDFSTRIFQQSTLQRLHSAFINYTNSTGSASIRSRRHQKIRVESTQHESASEKN